MGDALALWVFGDAFEEVCGLRCGLSGGAGDEGVVLFAAVLFEDGFDLDEEWGLRGVGAEGVKLAGEDGGDVEGDRPGRGERGGAAGEEVAGGDVEETLGLEERAESGVALGVSRPVESGGGGGGDDCVVGVGVEGAVAAEGEDDVGAEDADAGDDFGGEFGEGFVFELAVLVVEEFVVGDAEDVAGVGELVAAKLA